MKKEWYFIFVLAGVSLLLGSFQNSNVNYGPLSCPADKQIEYNEHATIFLTDASHLINVINHPTNFITISTILTDPDYADDIDIQIDECRRDVPIWINNLDPWEQLRKLCAEYCGASCEANINPQTGSLIFNVEVILKNGKLACDYSRDTSTFCSCTKLEETAPSTGGSSGGGTGGGTSLNNEIEAYIQSLWPGEPWYPVW